MSTATKTFDKRSLYHSDLAKHGEIIVQFTGTPRDSQYPNKPRWVGLMIPGDDTKYTLNIENADVEKTIASVPVNTYVTVRAEGRAETAFLLIEDGNGSPMLPPPKPAYQPPPATGGAGAPANVWPEAQGPYPPQIDGEPIITPTVAIAADMTIAAVKRLEVAGIRVDSDAAARIYNTHFIQASR